MRGLQWIKGKNYYQVKGWLEKQGFRKTSNNGFDNKECTSGWQEFDNGVETVTIYCKIIRNKSGNLQCDVVTRYANQIYDNLQYNFNNELNESYFDRSQQNKYDDMQKSAIYDYVSGYTSGVNDDLRKGHHRGSKNVVAQLDKAFDIFGESKPLNVYRTVEWDYFYNIYGCNKDNLQEFIDNKFIFQNKGYMSVASEFISPWNKKWFDYELVMHITSKRPVQQLNINNIFNEDEIDCSYQKEILLQRNTKMICKSFKIKEKRKSFSKSGIYVLEMEII